jgi:hypothetical protein
MMISEYACKSCGWTFVVGGYTSTEIPLRIATLLVCLDCGTGYRLEYVPSAKAYSFFVQPGPYKVLDRPHSVYLEWIPAPSPEQLHPSYAGFVKQVLQANIALPCMHCEATGTLTYAREQQTCPHCHAESLDLRGQQIM